MKVAALALVLLAVGTHAASMQPDTPPELQSIWSKMVASMNQSKDILVKALDQLDDAEYKDVKANIAQWIEDVSTGIPILQSSISAATNSVYTTVAEATADKRASILADIDELKVKVEPKLDTLWEVIKKHISEYKEKLTPITEEYYGKYNADMMVLKSKLDPILSELMEMASVNVEETKKEAMPIMEIIRAKVTERLENLKAQISPYFHEYKEQMTLVIGQVKSISGDDFTSMMGQIAPLAEEVKGNLIKMFNVIDATVTKEPTN